MEYRYLAHHGILGMKWGVRRYQNADGTLTAAGKRRYSREMNKLSNQIISKHHKQVMLFNSYPYEDAVTREKNNAIYKDTVNSLVSDLKEYKKAEDFVRSLGQVPVTELEKEYSFIKDLYADSPYRQK